MSFLVKDPEPKISGRGKPSIGFVESDNDVDILLAAVFVTNAVLENEFLALAQASIQ